MGQSLTDKIVEKIQSNISNGTWKIGDYIPSMRVIAEQEGVSRGVVTAAISILVGRGILECLPRHGMKICAKPETDDSDSVKNLVQQCAELIDKRRSGEDKLCRLEDVEAVRNSFSSLMFEELAAAREGNSRMITQDDIAMYDRGLRCTAWSPEKYSLYKCNLTTGTNKYINGTLLMSDFEINDSITFDDITMEYVEKHLHPNNASDYLAIVNRAYLLEKGKDSDYHTTFEYRDKFDDKYRWIRLNINLAKQPKTNEILAFMLYQNIDEEKRNELLAKERTEEDELTGALSRRAFMLQAEQLLADSDEGRQHAFLMIDIDGFKAVNDTFGHPVGDTVLIDISKVLRTILRYGDLFGRIGGDEFVLCLKDIPFDAVIDKKAMHINELLRRNFDNGSSISGSIGIAVYPRDGKTYTELYSKMDMALYSVKETGKDHYEYFHSSMTRSSDGLTVFDNEKKENDVANDKSAGLVQQKPVKEKKKILIVDDVEINRDVLSEMLKDDYTVLQAKDGRRALLTLRRYGTGISALLLDLVMPGMSGFEVLSNIQNEPILRSIPVIVVSGLDDIQNEFKAIEMGAMDFVRKPVDQRLLKLRLRNCVNKQENERLRIQNSYLQLQSEDELRYRHVIKSTGTIVIEHDWVNNVFTYDKSISQYLAGNYDHRSLWRILLSDMVASSMDVKVMQTTLYDLANSHTKTQATVRVRLKTPYGENHWFIMNALKIIDDFNLANKLLITLNDINNDVIAEERLRNLVEYDSLTGIYNRSAFLEKSAELVKQNSNGKLALSVIDIDGFKVYNHLYGHDEGDRLLIYLAKQLNGVLKNFGGICCRLQADTFAALHPSRRDFVESLSEAREKAISSYHSSMRISTCTGRCLIDNTDISMNAILDRAFIALKTAKSGLIKDVYFTDDMQRSMIAEQKIVSKMDHALADNQFRVYFQPIFEYNSKKMITAEVLVRWVTPDGRIIMPDDFVPLFEQNGFIVRLDAFVWEKACECMQRWLDAGIKIVPISVNVSRMDIYSGKLVDTIVTLTKKYSIPPELLRLEITESAYMKNSDAIVSQVEKLQRLGFTIEMDDFGNGFSSLNILSEVPVNILKLDMRFILGDDRMGRKAKIMEHIINLAKSSNIEVIAEGVETKEQAEFLHSLGCYNMQGYYFSRPVINTDFEKFFSNMEISCFSEEL